MPESEYSRRRVLTLSGGHFIHDMFSAFLPPLLPLLIDKLSLSMTLAGLLTVFFRIPSLANPFLGLVSDRINLRNWFVIAPAVTACCMCLLGSAPNYFMLIILLLIAGCSSAIYHVSGPVLIARSAGNLLGRGMSMWMVAGELARSVGPVICVGTIAMLGMQNLWSLILIALLATFILHKLTIGMNTLAKKKQDSSWKDAWVALRPIILPMAGLLVARGFVLNMMASYLPAYMVDKGSTYFIGGIALTLLELAGTAGTFMGGTISDKIGRKPVLLASLIIGPLLLILFLFSDGILSAVLLVLLGLSIFCCSPVLLALTQEFSQGHRGAANGMFMGLNFVITAVVLLLMGVMVDYIGFHKAFLLSGILALLAMPSALLLPWKQLKT